MNIAIIGSGNVGRAIGAGLSRIGHDVTFGVREPGDDRHADLDQVATRKNAVDGADIVVLAVPADAVADTVPTLGLRAGQIVVDATNAVGRPVPDGHTTMADLIATLSPEGIALVKAFNTISFEHMSTGEIDGAALFLPVAGDDEAAAVVAELAADIGFDSVVVGGREHFGTLEAHAQLWIRLAFGVGWGRRFGFTALHTQASA